MGLDYKYIQVARDKDLTEWAGKPAWYIFNRRLGDCIGRIEWCPSWRLWVFVSPETSIWSTDCLADVRDAIEKIRTGNI
jgi:hypothetical protein